MKNPKLILIGAGPGDPSLITVKGAEALKKADVVLYDALVHPELLTHTKKSVVKIFVGKRAGKESMEQQEINQLAVESAFGFGTVVRLKGGDPFIFGRGYEEIDYARKFGIEIEVIPGVSSSTGLTALQQIPLTTRGINDGFWVITGSTSEKKLSDDLKVAVKTDATVVILMGFKKLDQIVALYQKHGKNDLPVAIIQNGSFENEKIALGTVDTIIKEVEQYDLGTPAIIVLGEVVKLHPTFQKELLGKKFFKAKKVSKASINWVDKDEWTVRSGLPEPPGILPIEHLSKLRFRRAIRTYLRSIADKNETRKS